MEKEKTIITGVVEDENPSTAQPATQAPTEKEAYSYREEQLCFNFL